MDTLSTVFTALSDSTRRAILGRLAHGPAPVRELAAPFPISQQAISKHLAYLERARLIVKERRGREQLCVLHADAFNAVCAWLAASRTIRTRSVDGLRTVIEQEEIQPVQSADGNPSR